MALPDDQPIESKRIAAALGISRTRLYADAHPSLDYPARLQSRQARIEAAKIRQAENARLTPAATIKRLVKERLSKALAERDEWKARCETLQLTIVGMEYHASLNGWDADLLWRPLPSSERR